MQKKGKSIVRGDFRQITRVILADTGDDLMKQDFPSLRKILKEGHGYEVGMILSTQETTHVKTSQNNYAAYLLTWVVHRVTEIKTQTSRLHLTKTTKVRKKNL